MDGQEAYISHYKFSTSALRDFLNTKIGIEADLFVKDFFNPKTSVFLSKYLEEYEEEEYEEEEYEEEEYEEEEYEEEEEYDWTKND